METITPGYEYLLEAICDKVTCSEWLFVPYPEELPLAGSCWVPDPGHGHQGPSRTGMQVCISLY